MTDETVIDRDDEILGEPMPARPTKRDLVERGLDALNPDTMHSAKVSLSAGGVSFASVIEVMDFAKAMATAGMMIPKFLRGNPGGCLGITFQAIEWRMSPFQVANKSYTVNDRIGYESQLIHAVIEARAPLQHRLDCRYDGDGPTRTCTITGMFTTGDLREYTSPPLGKIRVKNSPLWQDDPDQQLFYYASRSWARKWCPDVLMGIYAREELVDRPDLGREAPDEPTGLRARLISAPKSDEGHRPGHAENELEQVAANGGAVAGSGAEPEAEPDRRKPEKRTTGLPRGTSKGTKREKAAKEPDLKAEVDSSRAAELSAQIDTMIRAVKTAKQYLAYARKWIKACDDSTELFVRWTAERKLRNALGVTSEDREPLDKLIAERRAELEQ